MTAIPQLLPDLVIHQAERQPAAIAIGHRRETLTYGELARDIQAVARGLCRLGLSRWERVAVYLPKQPETVSALFGIALAGGVLVPVNPLLKPEQVAHILRDCNVRILITTHHRLASLTPVLATCHDLHHLVLVDTLQDESPLAYPPILGWPSLLATATGNLPARGIDTDMTAILYTSGSIGRPKGVVLSHRNMLAGAHSVIGYLGNHSEDRLLSILPLSFDAGLSQLTTAFLAGARVILMDYLLPRDVVATVARESITGLTAVPSLWIQVATLSWPRAAQDSLRYIANTGGHLPRATLTALRQALPRSQVFLMYGLTEAFRSTYLPPDQVDRRPDSIGRAIPNAEIQVVREDGSACAPGEPGELVHRGSLVSLGYWNDPEKTAHRFRLAPNQPPGLPLSERAVWSGDTVRMDEAGYLYFIGRKDDMIKTSGYRVSPTEVEEVLYGSGLVAEAAAMGIPHPVLGQAVVAIVKPSAMESFDSGRLIDHCKQQLPNFMTPLQVIVLDSLPRNPNGKIDRQQLAANLRDLFQEIKA